MADNQNDNGLPLFSMLDLDPTSKTDKASQSETYLANNRLPKNKYGEAGASYQATAPENGLGNVTTEKNVVSDTFKYTDRFNKDGSDILFVNAPQTGNQEKAQVNDFTNYDKYFSRGNG